MPPVVDMETRTTATRTFRECATKWYFEHVLHVPQPRGTARAEGTLAHLGREALLRDGVDTGNKLSRAGLHHVATPERVATGEVLIEWPWLFDVPAPEGDGVIRMTGQVDVLDLTNLEIGDHKKTASLNDFALEPDELSRDWQLLTYALMASELRPEFKGATEVSLAHHYMESRLQPGAAKDAPPRTRTVRAAVSREVLERHAEDLIGTLYEMYYVKDAPIEKMSGNLDLCNKYGKCPYQARCQHYASTQAVTAREKSMSEEIANALPRPSARLPLPRRTPVPAFAPAPVPEPVVGPQVEPQPEDTTSFDIEAFTAPAQVEVVTDETLTADEKAGAAEAIRALVSSDPAPTPTPTQVRKSALPLPRKTSASSQPLVAAPASAPAPVTAQQPISIACAECGEMPDTYTPAEIAELPDAIARCPKCGIPDGIAVSEWRWEQACNAAPVQRSEAPVTAPSPVTDDRDKDKLDAMIANADQYNRPEHGGPVRNAGANYVAPDVEHHQSSATVDHAPMPELPTGKVDIAGSRTKACRDWMLTQPFNPSDEALGVVLHALVNHFGATPNLTLKIANEYLARSPTTPRVIDQSVVDRWGGANPNQNVILAIRTPIPPELQASLKAEVDEMKANASEPHPFIDLRTDAHLTLYINCMPVRGDAKVYHLSDLIAPLQVEAANHLNVDHYALGDGGVSRGAALVASLLAANLPEDDDYGVIVESFAPCAQACLEVLRPLAQTIITGTK